MAYTYSPSNPIFDPLANRQFPAYAEFFNPYLSSRFVSPLYKYANDFIERELGKIGAQRDKEADGDNLLGRLGYLKRGAASPLLREYSDWR